MKIISPGITKPIGFSANGLWCGIKRSGKPDLALIYSKQPATSACVFTKNSIIAAPLIVSKKHIKDHILQAIVINSGNANCFTGDTGIKHAEDTAKIYANLLNIKKTDVLVASTGIIGKPLAFDKIETAASTLVDSLKRSNSKNVAKAILTTDLFTKEKSVQIIIDGKKVTLSGCAKGSGMIAPNMATMLGFITTDANISANLLNQALKTVTEKTFNCITVDGCMSTNDMLAVMANGLANNKKITTKSNDYVKFEEALNFICLDLSKKIVLDGEGATKFITINVFGAKTQKQAKTIALKVANDNLVKTACYGSNPNWGRVAAAVGALGIKSISEKTLRIKFSSFKKKNISITVEINLGDKKSTVYTSDLSKEYVDINGKYN